MLKTTIQNDGHVDAYGSTGQSPGDDTIIARIANQRRLQVPDDKIAADIMTRYDLSADEAQSYLRRATAEPRTPTGARVVLTPYSAITSKRTDWVWDGRIPRSALTLWVGSEGLGKTASAFRFVADLSNGKLPGCFEGEPVNVALFTTEDDPERTISPRLDAVGADRDRVFGVKMMRNEFDVGISLPGDTEFIIDALKAADVRFAFIDPLAAMLDPKINTWKDTDVRGALTPFVSAAFEADITTLGILHTNKTNSNDPRQRGMGTVGWRQIARASFVVGLDPECREGKQGNRRCIAHDKYNLGRWTRTTRFTLDAVEVEVEGKPQEVVGVTLGDECDVTADAMLAAEQGHKDVSDSKLDQAVSWLRRFLEDGPKARTAVEDSADDAGHAWRTVEEAKKVLGVESFRPQGTKHWSWKLPDLDI